MTNADIGITVGLDTKELKKGADEAKRTLGGISDFAKGAFTFGIGAAVGGIAALTAGLGVSVKAAMEAEEGQAALAAVLASTNGVAGVTADMANEIASSLQNVTRFEDDTILSAENMLLTFTKISKDIFPDATETALNMATAFHMGPEQAAVMLGKALQDPIKGIGALQRVGVTFTEQQKKQVEAMIEAGDVMGAQKIILAELAVETGNAARAAGNTFAGKLDILNHKFGDLQETIGGAVIPVLTTLTDKAIALLDSEGVQNFINGLADALERLAKGDVKGVLKDIFGKETGKAIFRTASDIKAFVEDNLPALQSKVEEVFGKSKDAISEFWTEAKPYLDNFVKWLQTDAPAALDAWFKKMGEFKTVKTEFIGLLDDLRAAFAGVHIDMEGQSEETWTNIGQIVLNHQEDMLHTVETKLQQMRAGVRGITALIRGDWDTFYKEMDEINTLGLVDLINGTELSNQEFKAIWEQHWTDVRIDFENRWNSMVEFLGSIGPAFYAAGSNMIQSLVDGLYAAAGSVNSALWDIIQNAINSALGGIGGGNNFNGESFGGGNRPMLPVAGGANIGGVNIYFNGENAPRTQAEANRSAALLVDAMRAKGIAI